MMSQYVMCLLWKPDVLSSDPRTHIKARGDVEMRISGGWRTSLDPGSKRDPVSIMIEGKCLYLVPEIVLRPPQVAMTIWWYSQTCYSQ